MNRDGLENLLRRTWQRSAAAVRRSANYPLHLAEQRVPRQVAARVAARIAGGKGAKRGLRLASPTVQIPSSGVWDGESSEQKGIIGSASIFESDHPSWNLQKIDPDPLCEPLAAPEDVGGEDDEREHEDDPDAVRSG